MSYLSHHISEFQVSLHPGGAFHIVDDILSLVVFAGFSVVQVQVLSRLNRQSKKALPSRGSCVFKAGNVALGAGYLICATLSLAIFLMKLGLVAKHTHVVERSRPVVCPRGYVNLNQWMPLCLEENWVLLRGFANAFDVVVGVAFEIMVFLADFLMLYRCYFLLKGTWARTVLLVGSLRFAAFCLFAWGSVRHGGGFSGLITTYISLLVTLLTSMTLIVWLWLARRSEAKCAIGSSMVMEMQIPYGRCIWVVFATMLPPAFLGFVHIGLFAGLQLVPVALNVAWFSFTILVPQTIALRFWQEGDYELMGEPLGQSSISLPFDSTTQGVVSSHA